MTQELIDAAARYLSAGLPVIALSGKKPNPSIHRTWSTESALVGAPENDEERQQLAAIFDHPDTTGIGIPIPAHLVVIDIDGEDGARQWRELVGDDEMVPETPVAKTGRGLHLWFLTPREQGNTKLGPKLDVKGFGGYVAAPPSQHFDADGKPDFVYEWLDDLVGDGALGPIAWLPDAAERRLADYDAIETENRVERPVYIHYELSQHGSRWRLRAEPCPPPIEGLVHAVETAEEGNRNNILAWATLQARDEGLKLEDALRNLGGAGIKAGLDPREVKTTIRAAYRRSRR